MNTALSRFVCLEALFAHVWDYTVFPESRTKQEPLRYVLFMSVQKLNPHKVPLSTEKEIKFVFTTNITFANTHWQKVASVY